MPILTSDSRAPWMICEHVSMAARAAVTLMHAAQSCARVSGSAGAGAVAGADGAVADAVCVDVFVEAAGGAGGFCAHAACAVSASADAANANALRMTRLRVEVLTVA